jgi:transposase
VELFALIRRDARRGDSIRALARRYGVHRRTVRQALASALPAPRKPPVRRAARLEALKPAIDAMLRADLTAPRKQRHTVRRILDRLVDEHDAAELAYTTVRDYVARRRPEIAAETGRRPEGIEGYVPQTHAPGVEAEVDFGEVWVRLAGAEEPTKCFMFALRLSYSGKAVHKVFASQGQEAFFEGHLHAFATLGGVPTGQIRYDNLRSAVSRVLFGRTRTETARWVAFRHHYSIDPFYCQTGLRGAHEKGGVEGEIGRFRRAHLVPMPEVGSLAELNERIARAEAADDVRRIHGRLRSVGQAFLAERGHLAPLPAMPFESGLLLTPRVDRYARITVRQAYYSVPARLIGRRVRVLLGASELVVFDGRAEVARHARSVRKGSETLLLDHYLEVLLRKPGALAGSTALAQARAQGTFTAAHEAFWAVARTTHGEAEGTRLLIEVLLLHRHLPGAAVLAGIGVALSVGAASPDVVAVEARKVQQASQPATAADAAADQPPPTPAAPRAGRVISLTQRRLAVAGLPPDTRPPPSVARYDELLQHRRPPPAPPAPPDRQGGLS